MRVNPPKINTLFCDRYRPNVTNEAFLKDEKTEYDKFDWYIMPLKNSSVNGFIPTVHQNFDVDSCIYGSYFSTVIGNTSYLLLNKYIDFHAYESRATCFYPSNKLDLYQSFNESYCFHDSVTNRTYFSSFCRLYYINQKKENRCILNKTLN